MKTIIIDLEFTIPDRSDQQITEIIEIGAVCVEDTTMEELSSFETLVAPTINPYLTARCTEITHIEQEDLHDAPEFEAAIDQLMHWLSSIGEYRIYAWGVSDKQQLYKEVKKKVPQHALIGLISEMRDMQRMYMEKNRIKDRFYALATALNARNIQRVEPAHRALSDAKSTAMLLPFC